MAQEVIQGGVQVSIQPDEVHYEQVPQQSHQVNEQETQAEGHLCVVGTGKPQEKE